MYIGIICEFDPLHSGHARLLSHARAMGADAVREPLQRRQIRDLRLATLAVGLGVIKVARGGTLGAVGEGVHRPALGHGQPHGVGNLVALSRRQLPSVDDGSHGDRAAVE